MVAREGLADGNQDEDSRYQILVDTHRFHGVCHDYPSYPSHERTSYGIRNHSRYPLVNDINSITRLVDRFTDQ